MSTAPPPGVTVPQYTGEISVNEQPKDAPAAPTAPPLEKMDAIPGYQNIGFTNSEYFVSSLILIFYITRVFIPFTLLIKKYK